MGTDRQLLDSAGMKRTINQMVAELQALVAEGDRPALIGIRTHGVTLAQRMQSIFRQRHGAELPLGILDITLYRDDLNMPGAAQPIVRPTEIDFDIADHTVFLIDDVLYTGRTIRCALDELMDFGRPRAVKLAVLVDRGRRELPIQPDVVGIAAETSRNEIVKVCFEEADKEDGVWVHTRAPLA